ncbi:MAG TPA: hypothetical protein VK783_06035 [Bacteroidia bacterium]|nr:hypothetical protein [Bacteroidia bacterium]
MKNSFGDIANWKWFVFIAIILRGALWLYFGHLVNINLPADQKLYSYFIKDDYIYFFEPVDSYFKTGTFSYIHNIPFTGRMPGYSIIYFLFRLIFSQQLATYCVVATQFIVSSVSVYVLALTSYKLFKSKRAFYITFCLYVLAVFPGSFDLIIVAESFSVSALIFTFYFLVCYLQNGYRTKDLLLSGAFLTWTIFLREYTGLLIVLFPLAIGTHHLFIRKNSLLKTIRVGILFCLPFIIADSAWVIRNYLATKKFIPITTAGGEEYGKLYSASWTAIEDLIYTWGETGAPFDASTLAYYYRVPAAKIKHDFPSGIFNGVTTYNADSLIHLRQLYATYYYTKDTTLENTTQKTILSLCDLYKQDYIKHNEFKYIMVRPIKGLKYMMFFSGTGYLPMPSFSQCSLVEKLIKIVFTLLYYLVLMCAVMGLVLNIKHNKTKGLVQWLMVMSILLIITVVVFDSPIQEPRYSVHIFMMCILFATYFIDRVLPDKLAKGG